MNVHRFNPDTGINFDKLKPDSVAAWLKAIDSSFDQDFLVKYFTLVKDNDNVRCAFVDGDENSFVPVS
ncbi:unnamed protein product, partial [Timema podura]|nr:unnamed protein product [Timema podura]